MVAGFTEHLPDKRPQRDGRRPEGARHPAEGNLLLGKDPCHIGFGEDLGQGQVFPLGKRSKRIPKVEIVVVIRIR